MRQLSTNFSIDELVVSEKHPELAKAIVPTTEQILAAHYLAWSCLQPGRNKFGIFDAVSWLRDDALNQAVGGSSESDHKKGCAADIVPRNFHPEQVYKWYVNESGAPFRQIIYYPDQKFIHLSVNHPEKPYKHEALVCIGPGKYVTYDEYYS